MSWHCLFCGHSKRCNAQFTIYDIRGMVPMTFCCHLECITRKFPNDSESKEYLKLICKELIEKEEKKCK